jgi:predicted ATP-grasp superfamily ATP-dependent carboligase
MPTVLLTLGRLPKGLDLARSFAQSGWRVIVADPSASHLMGASRAVSKSLVVPPPATEPEAYLDALARIVRDESIDLVVPVSEDVMFVAELPERLHRPVPVFAMPAELIHRVHDKLSFIEMAAGFDLPVPETAVASIREAKTIADTGPYILKPRHSCAGNGVRLCETGAPILSAPDEVVQRRVLGHEQSTCSLALNGEVIATAIYRATMLSGTVACSFERIENPAIEEWVQRFIAKMHWTGFISFDFIVDANGTPYAIECNPRTTSGLHFFKTSDIAPAILGTRSTLGFRKERQLMQFWSCLQEAQNSFGDWPLFFSHMAHIWRTKDVTFSLVDPWPLIFMPWTARGIIAAARRENVSFGIAATRDLAWRGKTDAA